MSVILLIDDEAGHVLPLAEALMRKGHEVEAAVTRSAQEAMKAIERVKPGVLILDINLTQGGREGRRVARHAVENGVGTLIAHSSHPPKEQRDLVAAFGVTHFVNKDDIAGVLRCLEDRCSCRALLES